MTKSRAKKLHAIGASLERHEEAAEKNFSVKTVGIVKYLCGSEGGRLRTAKEAAKRFNVSESWVSKAQKLVSDFCTEMDKTAPKQEAPQARRMDFKGEINLETAVVQVSGDAAEIDKIQEALVAVVKQADGLVTQKIKHHAMMATQKLSKQVTSLLVWATVSFIVSAIISVWATIVDPVGAKDLVAMGLSFFFIVTGVTLMVKAVSLKGERRGLLQVRTF